MLKNKPLAWTLIALSGAVFLPFVAIVAMQPSDELLSSTIGGGSYRLRVAPPSTWEINRPILCSIWKENREIISTVCDGDDGLAGASDATAGGYLVINPSGPVVGLAKRESPLAVFFVADLQRGRSWPDSSYGPALIERLRAATGDNRLDLVDAR